MKLWREIQLKNLTTKITKGTTPTTIGFDFVPEGINFIKAESITRYGEIDEHTFAKIDSKTHEALRRSQIQEHDILVTIAGIYLGKIGLVKAHHIPANTNQAVAIVRADQTKVIPKYLKYFFLNKSTTSYLNMLCPQSAQPNLNLTQLGNVKLLLPDPKTQHKIASILSAYDDLIENNKRRIAILEKMAEEIYREWFVRMRFPASAKATACKPSLAYKGLPSGWRIGTVKELGKVVTGKTPPTAETRFFGAEYPFIKTPDMHEGIFMQATAEYLSEEGFKFQSSQQLPKGAICANCIGAGAGKYFCVTTSPSQTNQQINSLIPHKYKMLEWAYYTIRGLGSRIQMVGSTGATMTNVSKGKFENFSIVIPDEKIIDAFHEFANPLFGQIWTLQQQVSNLKRTRDLLLPRLISGKLSVEDLELPSNEKLTAVSSALPQQELAHA